MYTLEASKPTNWGKPFQYGLWLTESGLLVERQAIFSINLSVNIVYEYCQRKITISPHKAFFKLEWHTKWLWVHLISIKVHLMSIYFDMQN